MGRIDIEICSYNSTTDYSQTNTTLCLGFGLSKVKNKADVDEVAEKILKVLEEYRW